MTRLLLFLAHLRLTYNSLCPWWWSGTSNRPASGHHTMVLWSWGSFLLDVWHVGLLRFDPGQETSRKQLPHLSFNSRDWLEGRKVGVAGWTNVLEELDLLPVFSSLSHCACCFHSITRFYNKLCRPSVEDYHRFIIVKTNEILSVLAKKSK